MKINDMYNELLEAAKLCGITVRRETGNFRSGYAILKDRQVIIINKTTPIETAASVIARSLPEDLIANTFLKPVVRTYIENEIALKGTIEDFNLIVKY